MPSTAKASMTNGNYSSIIDSALLDGIDDGVSRSTGSSALWLPSVAKERAAASSLRSFLPKSFSSLQQIVQAEVTF